MYRQHKYIFRFSNSTFKPKLFVLLKKLLQNAYFWSSSINVVLMTGQLVSEKLAYDIYRSVLCYFLAQVPSVCDAAAFLLCSLA